MEGAIMGLEGFRDERGDTERRENQERTCSAEGMKHPSLGGSALLGSCTTHCTQSASHFAVGDDNEHDQGPRTAIGPQWPPRIGRAAQNDPQPRRATHALGYFDMEAVGKTYISQSEKPGQGALLLLFTLLPSPLLSSLLMYSLPPTSVPAVSLDLCLSICLSLSLTQSISISLTPFLSIGPRGR